MPLSSRLRLSLPSNKFNRLVRWTAGTFVKRANTISSAYRSEQTKRARSNWLSLSPRTVTRAGFIDIRRGARVLVHYANTALLHLKSGLAYLDANRLVVTETLAERKEFAEFDLVRVRRGEEYAANCIRVNDYVLVAAGHEHFQETLRELGYQTMELEMTEFQKMDGGLSCLSLRW